MPISEAPIADKMVDDNIKCRPSWVQFFALLVRGDSGVAFTPSFTSLGQTGAPTISGVYYQNNGFADFFVKIVPATNTSSVFGTTNFKLPFSVSADVPCGTVIGGAVGQGVIQASTGLVFPPTWTNITVPVTISGRVKL